MVPEQGVRVFKIFQCGAVAMALWVAGANTGLAASQDGDLMAFSAAYFDVNQRGKEAGEFRIEYRADEHMWIFKPFGGAMATTQGSVHGFAGVLIDIPLWDRIYVTPSFAPGLYYRGNGSDLHHTVEFRSQIEITYRFPNGHRFGASFNHISNANLGNDNPGVESAALTYIVPFDAIFAGR
ncbi:MAG: acyloxyacyl hydrolase [Alphaproteobacteria bacterium]|nr:acyloxyacyl hydrolase [Alphaproteobacteria bacterium]